MTLTREALIAWVKAQAADQRSVAAGYERVAALAQLHLRSAKRTFALPIAEATKRAAYFDAIAALLEAEGAAHARIHRHVHERLDELREWRRGEERGYTRSAYDAQIEELERLIEECPSLALPAPPTTEAGV